MSAADVESLLRSIREGSDAERRAALARLESDPTLRQQAEKLMAATLAPVDPALVAAMQAPRQVGPYRLLEEIGSGGMGAVYLAERDIDGAVQRVALKLLHGIPGSEGRRRFARERALLAGLNHPNIAALLDAGETAQGQPWLAMEYVEGLPIDEWVRREAPSLRARLHAVVRICGAVDHAHARLVLHRDIKPGNVLVRADGDPVLLDFGIARVLEEGRSTTETATVAYTPAYAAPEQLAGAPLTTTTDVYGLGTVMHECLGGVRLAELRRVDRPLPPVSTVTTDPALARALRGDLDRIVAKALHEDPERRYASPAALAEDLGRFLAGRPVLATPDSAAYRLRKFIARHRPAAVISGLALLASVGFVWQLGAERDRARAAESRAAAEAQAAQRARDFLVSVFAAAAPAQTLGEPVSPRQLLDHARERVAATLGDEPHAAVATWLALADTYAALGASEPAWEAAREAMTLTAGAPEALARERADALEASIAALNAMDRFGEAEVLVAELLRLREERAAEDPAALINTWGELGYAEQQRSRYEASVAHFRQALERWQVLATERPDPAFEVWLSSGLALSQAMLGDQAAAQSALAAAARAAAALDGRHPSRLALLRASARVAEQAGDYDASVAALVEASGLARRVVGADARQVAAIENDLGVALNGLGRYRESIEHLQRARAAFAAEHGEQSLAVAHLDHNLSAVHESLGEYQAAIRYGRAALAAYAAASDEHLAQRKSARMALARALSFAGQHGEAVGLAEQALAESARVDGPDSLDHAFDGFRLAGILRRGEQLDEAAGLLAQVGPRITAAIGAEHPAQLHLMRLAALLARDRGERSLAEAGLVETIAFGLRTAGADPVALAEARLELAELRVDEDPARAREEVEQAAPVLRERLSEQAPAPTRLTDLERRLSR